MPHFTLAHKRIPPGRTTDINVPAGESATGRAVNIPVRVVRGDAPGPVVAVTAAVHGDEINGMGAVRALAGDDTLHLSRGTLLLVPVINIPGFERTTRYMPDRRDLNRSFPGSASGSLTARYAHAVFDQIIRKTDYLIDLHAAAAKRTNFPNVRADLDHPKTAELARLFGAELTVHGKGPEGSLRRSAVEAGLGAIILEAGEVWKFEPGVAEAGVRGVMNVLRGLGMAKGEPEAPLFSVEVRHTSWLRADHGGILRFHVAPGEVVDAGEPVATATTLLGEEIGTIEADEAGIVLGMTTLPAVVPGDPVVHLAVPEGGVSAIRSARRGGTGTSLDARLRDDLATNIVLHEHDEEDPRNDQA